MKRVLVVEDDPDIRSTLTQLLDQEGLLVTPASNGREALRHLRRDPSYCLILLDMIMPEMCGEEFLEEKRKDPALAPIPVIAMTAGRSRPQGVDAVMEKPFELEPLLDLIRGRCAT